MAERRDPALAQLVSVRFKEFIREPEAIFWTFIFPVILAVGLGVAFRNRPPEVQVVGVVAPAGREAAADSIAASLATSPQLRVTRLADDSAARTALRTGRVALVAAPGADGGVEYRFDDTRPEGRYARLLADDAVQRGAGRADPVRVAERQVRERGSRYIDFLIPGLLGMNIMGGGMWGVGFAIVDARRKNLLKRLVATPMRRSDYLLSFIISRLAFLVVEVVFLLGMAALLFDVPVRGSLLQLGGIALVASLAFTGLGLLTVSRAKTIEAASGLMNVVMLPQWVLSGVFFSSANFPAAAQPFIKALPLTATIDALRETMIQGLGWPAVAPELAVIAAWLLGSVLLSLRLFRWR
ncbi:MAG: ABC transporter permease [Gemmatimonadaceae bacterium]